MQASESLETRMIDSAIRVWKSNADRIDKFFGALSPEQLEQEIAPEEIASFTCGATLRP
jgi:hypothetical protein